MEFSTVWKRKRLGENHLTDIVFFVSTAMFHEKIGQFGSVEIENRIWYDGKKKRLWATDGARLHIAGVDFGNDDFTFHIISKRKNEIIGEISKERPNLPNISIILQQRERTIAYFDFAEYLDFPKTPEIPYVKFMRLFQKAIISQEFFNDLFNIPGKWKALIAEENSAQFFKNENCLAAIMPLNVD